MPRNGTSSFNALRDIEADRTNSAHLYQPRMSGPPVNHAPFHLPLATPWHPTFLSLATGRHLDNLVQAASCRRTAILWVLGECHGPANSVPLHLVQTRLRQR